MRYRNPARLACLIFFLCGSGAPASARAALAFSPAGADMSQLRAALDAQRISYEQLVGYYLERIARFDHSGPNIHALISVNSEALLQARQLDRDKSHRHHGALFGIPFIVKDNFNTASLPTSGGSAALQQNRPASNAFVVQRLLDEGAILLAKANMSELASSYGRLGYSAVGGVTRNPFNLARDASGSSSGSAAAIAADFAPFALGTDTSGSIRGPANVTGLAGLRPTLGLTSRSGIIPLALSFDTPGILARTVADVADILDVIAAIDTEDTATFLQPKRQGSYASGLRPGALRGARLGVVTNFRGGSEEVDQAEQQALETLRAQGAELVEVNLPDEYEHLWPLVMRPVSEAQFRAQIERYLRTQSSSAPQSLADLIEKTASSAANPALLEALRAAQASELSASPTYLNLLSHTIPSLRDQMAEIMRAQKLTALVFATMSCPASPRFDEADATYLCRHDDPYRASYVASTTGFPEVTVPVARLSGHLPMGLSLLGTPFTEAQLLSLAHALQIAVGRLPQATLYSPPRVEPTALKPRTLKPSS